MKADDVKVGTWVVRYGKREMVTRVESFGFEVMIDRGERDFVHDGMPFELWKPSVGEWVHVPGRSAARVMNVEGEVVLLRFDDRQEFWWGVASITPCAPPSARPIERMAPESKPATFAMADAYTYSREDIERAAIPIEPKPIQFMSYARMIATAKGPEWQREQEPSEPCATPHAVKRVRAAVETSFGAVGDAERRAVLYDGLHPRSEDVQKFLELAMPRTHNAACPKCGGRAYQGLLNAECIEPVCDDPRTRMPDRMQRVGHKRELVWRAEGRGVFMKHPTKEGAIAAWREAVNRG